MDIQAYENDFMRLERAFHERDVQHRRAVGQLIPAQNTVVLGGYVQHVALAVLTGEQSITQVYPAFLATMDGLILIETETNRLFPNLKPSLERASRIETVRIDVEPNFVPEEIWLTKVVSQLGVEFNPVNPWAGMMAWAAEQRHPHVQSVLFSLHTVNLVRLPGTESLIDGYARRGGIVIAAQSGFIANGLGGAFAAHEILHCFGPEHNDTNRRLGYFGEIDIPRNDLMSQISLRTISEQTLRIAGLVDRNNNGIGDIHETDFVIENVEVQDSGVVQFTVHDRPVPPAPGLGFSPFNPHSIIGAWVKLPDGNRKLAQVVSGRLGKDYRVGFIFSLPALDLNRRNLVMISAETDFPEFTGTAQAELWIGGDPNQIFVPVIGKK